MFQDVEENLDILVNNAGNENIFFVLRGVKLIQRAFLVIYNNHICASYVDFATHIAIASSQVMRDQIITNAKSKKCFQSHHNTHPNLVMWKQN